MMILGTVTYVHFDTPLENIADKVSTLPNDLPNLSSFKELWQHPTLLADFGGSWQDLDKYIGEARKAGKNDDQIRMLFRLLPALSNAPDGAPICQGKELVSLGLFDEIAYNACSIQLLHILMQKDVLLYAFTRPGMLYKERSFSEYWVPYSARHYKDAYCKNEKEYLKKLKWSELDNVLIHFAQRIGMKGFPALRLAQINFDNITAKPLFYEAHPLPRGQTGYGYMPCVMVERAHLLGFTLSRFMSERDLRAAKVESKTPWEEKYIADGALFRRAFPKTGLFDKWSCNII